jgi:hypothetical protein
MKVGTLRRESGAAVCAGEKGLPREEDCTAIFEIEYLLDVRCIIRTIDVFPSHNVSRHTLRKKPAQ